MKNRSRFLPSALLPVLAATLLLAACGGSDAPADGAQPPPAPTEPDTTAPVLAFTTTSPIAVDGSITIGSDEPLADGAEIRVLTGDIITVAGTVSVAADRRSFTWTPAAPLRYEMALAVFAEASDPSGNGTSLARTMHTVDPPTIAPWWPPVSIAPIGTRVTGPQPLPAGCTGWPATCYKDAVRDGTVQFLQAGGGSVWDGRPVIFGFYRMVSPGDGVTPWWSLMPENLDDGWRPDAGPLAIAWLLPWSSTREIDWVEGSAAGLVTHDAASGTCTEYELPGAIPRTVDCP